MSAFKDHFTSQAAGYAQFRPRYPAALFAYLAGAAPERHCAWDCCTGNGQAAVALTDHFERVVATDASGAQIAHAQRSERIDYRVETAERSTLASTSVDLITVAQAAHWLDLPRFFDEARRVLKPHGILALWTYAGARITPEVDRITKHFYKHVVGAYWPPERRHVERGYGDLGLAFSEPIDPPAFEMLEKWTFDELCGYLRTWSATQRFRDAEGSDPVDQISAELAHAWGAGAPAEHAAGRLDVRWPLTLRLGRL